MGSYCSRVTACQRAESSIVVDRCNAIHVTDRRYVHSRSKACAYVAFIRIGGIEVVERNWRLNRRRVVDEVLSRIMTHIVVTGHVYLPSTYFQFNITAFNALLHLRIMFLAGYGPLQYFDRTLSHFQNPESSQLRPIRTIKTYNLTLLHHHSTPQGCRQILFQLSSDSSSRTPPPPMIPPSNQRSSNILSQSPSSSRVPTLHNAPLLPSLKPSSTSSPSSLTSIMTNAWLLSLHHARTATLQPLTS